MDKFPDDYVSHNLPLLILSGLEGKIRSESEASGHTRKLLHEGGFRIKTDAPLLRSDTASQLLDAFLDHDGSNGPWRAQSSSPREARLFRIRSVGRACTLPARKAPPPPHSPRFSAADGNGSAPPLLVLHSPLSPLTPSSPLYPDGIISPLWITKHQSRLPSAFLTFFTLTADANTSSLQDNKIKSEINDVRGVFSSTNYKTKLIVILLADGVIDASELEDRLGTIRRSTGLDLKSLHFIPSTASHVEFTEFARLLLSSLHPLCIEYYRDLSKHARRKRNRSSTPQPTIPPTTAHMLPQQGWNVRYEFKLGVFAEFRQEMDAACRNYETAYENLFSTEMIDSIAAWSPRLSEARMLADVIAIRILRCLLWTGQGTTAVRTWTSHRDRMRDFVNRRGSGAENYGWEAWQSTWSKTMANLITRSEIASLNVKVPSTLETTSVFAIPEKSLPTGERLLPWELLHHEGYWLDMAQTHTVSRRKWALQIPVEDRQPPERPLASRNAGKTRLYDAYLTLEPYAENPIDDAPGFNYVTEIVSNLDAAAMHFAKRGQLRMGDSLGLKKASEHLRAGSFSEAALILIPLWKSHFWREAGWWNLLQKVGEALLQCAHQLKDPESTIRLTWELASSVFLMNPSTSCDLRHILDDYDVDDNNHLAVAIDAREAASRLVPSITFVSGEGHVGEPIECQLTLRSCSQKGSPPIQLTEAKIVFEGSFKPIYLVSRHTEQTDSSAVEMESVVLEESATIQESGGKRSSLGAIASLTGQANLVLHPGQTRIFNFQAAPREAGAVSVASITLIIEEEKFNLTTTTLQFDQRNQQWWEMRGGRPQARTIGLDRSASRIDVQPKPPKIEFDVKDLKKTYYTNEDIVVALQISNLEEEPVMASAEARLISPVERAARFRWTDKPQTREGLTPKQDAVQVLPTRQLGALLAGANTALSMSITDTNVALDHELEVTVRYKLPSDQETVLTKAFVLDLAVVRPFESNYDFLPRLSKDAWPSFFEAPLEAASTTMALGLKQNYLVEASIFSFATEPIFIEAILLIATKVTGGATCTSTTGVLKQEPRPSEVAGSKMVSTQIEPEQTRIFTFDLSVQKLVLGDRHTVDIDLALEIGWRRPDSEKVNTSVLEVPQFLAPMAEPRVTLNLNESAAAGSQAASYELNFLIENPSMHFLTFSVAMESSEDYAFSGPKSCSVSLVPISRHEVRYRILPNKKGEWVKVQLNVVDAYFGQTLRVQPAGDGVKADKKGNILVYVA